MTTTKTTNTTKRRAAAILARLREPSTMAGLSALALLAGVPPGVPEAAMQGIAAVAGLLAVLLPEGGR
ncbi:hypothetical protein QWZ02_09410 [Kinneretia asaccharophila]|uniref:Uncharacterized protein n=1 Tax=Roseateles asaccharophilus TaxID=582607 RepID=A0A4R6N346_9BURK|nr:hypothetical protein [Roseateles asaccharophilus]MDN3544664.1 hypothetical protein [Roseateles asaccharophilus]TDP09569.1 hypothetical protein DFR39_104130 [Roseateles asaccharophilus]